MDSIKYNFQSKNQANQLGVNQLGGSFHNGKPLPLSIRLRILELALQGKIKNFLQLS